MSQSSNGGGGAVRGAAGIVAVPPCTAALVVWRLDGELRLTIIAKASFVIVPEQPMALAEPEPIVTAEVHHGNSVARSIRLSTENAPRVPRTDVILTGHACAPEGQPTRWIPARLAVFRERALLDKTIYVYGDDAGNVPFERVPLVYERAHGGLGFRDNPLGTGILELSSRPNLVHPERADEVACFAPISRTWPARRRLLGAEVRKAAEAASPEIHAGFDWSYFQVAPLDQRIDGLHGDEWLVLEGMSATNPRVRSRLPSARAEARLFGLPGTPDGAPLALIADTLRVDADRMGCFVVWRADIAVPSEEALAGLRVVVGVETEQLAIQWPEARDTPDAPEIADPETDVIELDAEALVPLSTVTLEGTPPAKEEAPRPVVPFIAGTSSVLAAPSSAPRPLPRARFGETVAVTEEPAGAPSMPFVRPLPNVPPPQWAPVAPGPSIPHDTAALDTTPRPASSKPARVLRGKPGPLGIRLDAPAELALGVIAWGLVPARDCLAVIVKATSDIEPGAPAKLRSEAVPLTLDVLAEEGRVCVHPGDYAPFKVRADVVAVGSAHAPSGSAASMDVGFRFGHEGNSFDRSIRVFGDRRWQKGVAGLTPSPALPFTILPITYERAFGGPKHLSNPVGVGMVERFRSAAEPLLLPNLEDPDALLRVPSMRPPPACFAPAPSSWSARRGVERRSPWLRFPEDLDWTQHQIAPPRQQLCFLRGDEPFALTGMHRMHASLEGALPGLRARAFALSEGDRFAEVPLALDTVVIDADALTVTQVWRGVLPVESEARPDVLSVHALTEPVGKEGISLDQARGRFAS